MLRLAAMLTPFVLVVAVGMPSSAPAHKPNRLPLQKKPDRVFNERTHARQDSVPLRSAKTERRMSDRTVRRSKAALRRLKKKARAAQASSTDPGVVGRWGPVEDWPVVGIQVALLPNGKVLAFDAVGDRTYTSYTDHSFTRASVWDPATGTHTPAWVDGYNLFCAGFAHLASGTLFLAGGNADQFSSGIVQTHVFNHGSNTWARNGDMQWARWYPSVTPLTNGEMLITGGRPWIPEVRRTDGVIRQLSEQTAAMDVPFYPWMDVAPDGLVFYSGPDDVLRKLDPSGGGAWQSFGARGDGVFREYGSHAVYDIGKQIVAGGGPSTSSARTIDFNGSTPSVSTTSPMAFGRRQFNLTVLADGQVLATGGNSTGTHYIDMNGGVYNAELWNPATGNWTTLAAESVTRQYHSSALLLPDGRILSSGGGICDDCDAVGYLGKNAQVFTPPYLFKKDGSGELATRPEVTDAPSAVPYGADFTITTPDAASIRKVGLVRLGSNTHAVNFEQRYIPLSFTAGTGSLTATIPSNANVAPPGPYMLFVVDESGVPSVAKMVNVASDAPEPPPPPPPPPPGNQLPTVSLTQPASGSTFTAPATVELAADAADADGHVTAVNFYAGTTKLGEDFVAPFTFSWGGVGAGTYELTARAIDEDGGTTTSAPVTIDVRTANQPPTVTLTQPAGGSTFTAPATVEFAADAADADGHVTAVQFYNGTTKLGEDLSAPYTFTWSGVGAGTYSVSAKAIDEDGGTTTSGAATISVVAANTPPTASITSPENGAVFPFKPTITFSATASDPDGTVTKVDFFDGTTLLASDTTAPYSYSWKNASPGTHTLRVRATDNAGAVTTSAPVGITVRKR